MREKDRSRSFGFMWPTLAIAMALVFCAGAVLLIGDGVSTLKSGTVSAEAIEHGEQTVSRVEALVKCTRVLNDNLPCDMGGRGYCDSSRYDFFTDIDGEVRTGGFCGGNNEKGLERIVIYRPGAKSRYLLADVYFEPGEPRNRTVLSRNLDPGDPQAFNIKYSFGQGFSKGSSGKFKAEKGCACGLCEKSIRLKFNIDLMSTGGGLSESRRFGKVINIHALAAGQRRASSKAP